MPSFVHPKLCKPSGLTPERLSLEQFIADTFLEHYNAKIEAFCEHLLGVRNAQGSLCAAIGYNFAEQGPLFLEQYLDAPIEDVIESRLGVKVSRQDLVEVGNLSAKESGGARMLIRLMTSHLHQCGRQWVAFTATKALLNSFNRLGLPTVTLAQATPDRVQHPETWGCYYEQSPQVVIGEISIGYRRFFELLNNQNTDRHGD
jgi:hypothetical protein